MSDSSDSSDSSSASFVDDGVDIRQRMPPPRDQQPGTGINIPQWIDASSSEGTSSFYDDGADLLPVPEGAAPGFGEVHLLYYHDPAPKNTNMEYHSGVRKAVEGQINNMLKAQGAMSKFTIGGSEAEKRRAAKHDGRKETGGKVEKAGSRPQPVKVFVPAPVPDFVIHGGDGHVVVVDSEDEVIDSRPPAVLMTLMGKLTKGDRSQKGGETEKPKQNQSRKREEKGQENERQGWKQSGSSERGASKGGKKSTRSANFLAKVPVPDLFLMSGGLGISCPDQFQAPSEDHATEDTRSNYMAPTVEDAADTPLKEKREYLNGYDEPLDTYCNGDWGGIPVHVATYISPW